MPNTINTRIQLKYDSYANWLQSTFIPLKGEVCIAEIPNATSNTGLTPPSIGIKIGDGRQTFNNLSWIQAIAGDVYGWAKAADKPTYAAEEITGLNAYISGQIQDTNTVYRIIEGTGNDDNKYYLQSKASTANDTAYTTISTIDLSDIYSDVAQLQSDLNDLDVSEQIDNKIAELDVNNISGFGAGKTLATLTEVDGKIAATFQNISITASQVSNAGTAITANVATAAITDNDTSSDLATKSQVATYVANKTAGLTGAMHFIGELQAVPTSGSYAAGDVILVGDKEYVYDATENDWIELGDEGSYALKTVTISAGSGLTGGGSLEANRTINHAVPNGAGTSNDVTASAGTFINAIEFDQFGHVVDVGTGTATTYAFAEGSTNGAFQVTPSNGSAQSVSIHGLGSAAYANLATNGVANNEAGLVSGDEVHDYVGNILSDLNGAATATAANGNVYSVLTSVTQTNGEIAKGGEVTLAAIAKTGSIYDVVEHNTVSENGTVNYLIFDCGDATHLITNAV